MKTNEELQKNVQEALKWEPLLHAAEIGVTVKDGVVTLTGVVDSFSKKSEAEDAAKNVTGVKAVVEKIEVSLGNWGKKEDSEIANEILNAFKWSWEIPNDKLKVKVEKGWVTLEGELPWNYQREAANRLVNTQAGVLGVTNKIEIKSEVKDAIEKEEIECALERNGSINDEDISVTVAGTKVTLNGTVDSWYQKSEAGRVAWNAPGVWTVANELEVDYDN
jgi:osmotically-inducible protein OsmY